MPLEKKYMEISLTEEGNSPLEQAIRRLPVDVCTVFIKGEELVPAVFIEDKTPLETKDTKKIKKFFPQTIEAHKNKILSARNRPDSSVASGKRVAVLFSGGPAAGGHNVIVGLKKILGESNSLFGIKSGPKGLLKGELIEVTEDNIQFINNTGGFDYIGSDRTKIKSEAQFAQVRKACLENNIDALVIIGGDDSNTNAGVLAEMLYKDIHSDGRGVQVIGVPKTIDGDLQVGSKLPISFGFHTATSIYAELVGNILQDTPSSRKYWHFVKLMGRSASHVTLEVALQTKPALTLISEEIAAKKMTLNDIVDQIAATVIMRARKGMNYGVVLVPEGLIEFIPEMTTLISELNEKISSVLSGEEYFSLFEHKDQNKKREYIYSTLPEKHVKLMKSLPGYVQDMLLAERDSHGNLQVSLIPTEQLLIEMVAERIKEIDSSITFHTQKHFFGYEGRCGVPTKFDMAYCINLGMTAGSLILEGYTGYLASISEIDNGGKPIALPLTGLFNIERRHGNEEVVIKKALVELDSEAFKYFASRRNLWAEEDRFASPGPRQLWGPVSQYIPKTVFLNTGLHHSKMYNLGMEMNLFPDILLKKTEDFLNKYHVNISVDKEAIRELDEKSGLEYYNIILPNEIIVDNIPYNKGTHIAINKYGNIYVVQKESL